MILSRKTKRVLKNLSLQILEILNDLIDTTDAFIFSANSTRLFHQKLRENRIRREKVSRQLNYLKDQGYIEYSKKQKYASVKLTLKGKIKLLENSDNNKVDGKWRMLSFDIPEEIKRIRNQFRSAIKRIGFRQVHLSLWASPFVKADQIAKLVEYHEVGRYVAYLIVEKTDIEEHLKELFKDQLKRKKQ